MLLSTLSKYLHRALRPSICRHFIHSSLPLHLGGKPGVPVSLAAHIIRGYLRWKARKGLTACVLFADISSAFYAAVRQLAAPVEAPSLPQICAGFDIPEGALEELQHNMAGPCALQQEQAPPWLATLAAQLHSATWMTVSGASDGYPSWNPPGLQLGGRHFCNYPTQGAPMQGRRQVQPHVTTNPLGSIQKYFCLQCAYHSSCPYGCHMGG